MKEVTFSIDLADAAIRHLDFLDKVSAIQDTLTGPALAHALRRYEQRWLILADECRSYDLAAPIDIEWLWYIHMLSPLAYRRDCRKIIHRTLNHEFPPEDAIVSRTNTTIELWYAKYKLDGYNIIRNGAYARPVRNKGELQNIPSKLSIDLILNAEHHIHFCYQVALPHFRDKKCLQNAVERYKQFLYLKREEPNEFLTPSVDIMLIWFTHMCHPKAYARDLLNTCGQVLDNNIKVRPTLITENFLEAQKKTNVLFEKLASSRLLQPGCKLRSNNNTRAISVMTLDDLANCCVVTYRVYIGHAELTGMPTRMKNFQVKLFLTSVDTQDVQELLDLDGPRKMWSLSTPFHFNTAEHRSLTAQLWHKHRIWCIRGEQATAAGKADILPLLQQKDAMGKSITIEINLEDEVKLVLDGSVQATVPHLCSLVIQCDEFKKQILSSKEIKRMLGSVSVPADVRTAEQTCYISSSRLANHNGIECFLCRVIHIPEVLCSGVQIFYGTKLVATSDVIGSSHLPTSTQVEWSELSMAFDPELGERAMLIRNNKGDWGLCVAKWNQDKAPGFLEVRFMRLSGAKKVVSLELTNVELEFLSFTTNLYTGEIFVNPTNNTVGENLALVFSIGILYILCAPQKLNRELSFTTPIRQSFSSQADLDRDESAGKTNTMIVDESNCQLLLAAGLTTVVPNNAYILSKFGTLSHDLNLDVQDMIVEEQVLDRKLFRKESKELKGDFEISPRKTKRKHKSKFRETTESPGLTDHSLKSLEEEKIATPKRNQVAPLNINNDADTEQSAQKDMQRKRKRLKHKKSSKLDEMLSMSDDSITKDDIEEKILKKNKQGKTIAVTKISNLKEELVPSDDSIDKDEEELEEFLNDISTMKNTEKADMIDVQSLTVAREETTIIRDIVEKKKNALNESETVENTGENLISTIQDMDEIGKTDDPEGNITNQNFLNSEPSNAVNDSSQNNEQKVIFLLSDESSNI